MTGILAPSEKESEMQIINLSTFTLSANHMRILKKGLSFSPTPSFDEFGWARDINLFARKLALHKFHTNRELTSMGERGAIEALEYLHHQSLGIVDLVTPPAPTKI